MRTLLRSVQRPIERGCARTDADLFSSRGTLPHLGDVDAFIPPVSTTGIWGDVVKQHLAIGVALLAGTVIGAAAVTGLHAQGKPSVFVITEIDISDPEGYGNEFVPKA
jgi:hypothetical protein